jgi:hypothetical protein
MVASANRKGTAGILPRSAISSSKGVPNKQTASFSITAEARPALKTTDASSAFRLWHLLSALQIHAAKRVAHVREISLASTGRYLGRCGTEIIQLDCNGASWRKSGGESLNQKFCGQQMRCYTDILGIIGIVSSLL